MAATATFELEIWIDGHDEPILVRADQRDAAAFEKEHKTGFAKALDDMPMTLFRFLGWSAARRLGKIPPGTPRESWLDSVVSVEPVGDELEPEPADPGSPAASEGNSST